MGILDQFKNKSKAGAKLEIISKEEFKKLADNANVTLIDVRTPEEFREGKIFHAKNINYFDNDFSSKINELDKEKPVYLYCRSGNRSQKAAKKMQKLGFKHIIDLEGGYMNW